MYPCDIQVLEQLLTLIEHGECRLALTTWSEHRHQVSQTCDHCPYKDIDKDDDCCMCLESKLRFLSLYECDCEPFEQSLLNAARKLAQYHQQPQRQRFF